MNKARVLYVDDDIGNLSGFRDVFQQYYNIHLAESAEQGFALLRDHEFDVILSDQCMPVVTGTEFLRRVQEQYPRPFRMILTGANDIDVVIDAINHGHLYYYFSIPWDEHEIRMVIDHAVEIIALKKENEQLWSDLQLSRETLEQELVLRKHTEAVLNTRIRQQSSAAEISRMMLAPGRLDELMQEILSCVSETLSADSCTILELLPDGVTLLLRASYGWSAGQVGELRVRADTDSPIGLTVKMRQPITFEDLNVDDRFAKMKLVLRDNGMVSGASVVIAGNGGIWGTLSVHSHRRQHFNADDVDYLEIVAKILADAIAAIGAQANLQRSEQLLRRYYDAGLVGMALSIPGKGWIQVNDTFCDMVGYTSEELLGSNWMKIVHPEESSESIALFNRLLAGEIEGHTGDSRYLHRDGHVVPVTVSVKCARKADGGIDYIVAFVQDVSERWRWEEALRKSEHRLKIAQSIAHIGYWERDVAKNETYWSDELFIILGLNAQAVKPVRQTLIDLLHPEDRPGVLERMRAFQDGKMQAVHEYRIVRPDGEIRYLHTQGGIETDNREQIIRQFGTVIDVTDIKLADETIKKSEIRLREAQRVARLGLWEWSIKTKETYWSDEMYVIAGVDPVTFSLNDESIMGLLHPEDRRGYQEFFRTILRDGTLHDFEHRILLPGGGTRYHNVHAELVRDADGEPVRILGTVMDVTERRETQAAIKKSEHRLREAQRLAKLGFWEIDLKTDAVFWSDELYALTGLDPKTFHLSHENISSFVPAEERENYDKFFQKVLSNGFVHGFEHRVLTSDGRMRYHNVHGELIRDEDGTPIRMLGTVMDVTDRRQAQESLRNAHEELEQRVEERTMELYLSMEQARSLSAIAETTLQNMGQGIIMVDGANKILIYNNLLEKYTGISRERAMACRSLDEYLLLFKHVTSEENFLREAQYSLMRERITYEMTTREGIIIEVRQNPLLGGGFVRTYTDITQLKNVQADYLVAKEKAEAANVAKANFLATMSHEIRTPMNGVIGMTDLLLQSRLDDEQREMLQTINDCSQSLLTIINDILDFSKIEAGKLELEAIPMSLTDVLEGSAQAISHYAIRKGLRLLTYVDPDLPQFVTGDPVRLRQILINLGGNAIKFTEKGKVVIRADQVANSEMGTIIIRFTIKDEGIGISRDNQRNLFKVFTQAESSTTRRYGGTGLGLSICQRLAEMMNGEIGVHSSVGEGSEFYLTLMFSHSNKVLHHSNVSDLAGLRVLLIVADAVEREIYQRYLEHWHAEIDSQSDLAVCVGLCQAAACRKLPYDVVIICSNTAVEKQQETSRIIIEDPALARTRFVFLKRGRRRRPRLENDGCVTLDVDQLRRAGFISAVSIASGRASPEVDYNVQIEELQNIQTARAPSVSRALELGSLILVAEDNPTNRDVIRRQLNVLGYACEMVEDGKQALAAWRDKRYAILLTDCQMPNMDGFELTNHIRQDEEKTKKHTVIIAITANALRGEAERCLASGMDDYLPKPIDLKDLREKLRRWLPIAGETTVQQEYSQPRELFATERSVRAGGSGAYPIDEQVLKNTIGNDPSAIKEILHDFIDPTQKVIWEMENSWKERCAEDIKKAAHKLKSSARSIGAVRLANLCVALEHAGKEQNWEQIDEEIPALNGLMTDIEKYINHL